jgi:hypothetical protein
MAISDKRGFAVNVSKLGYGARRRHQILHLEIVRSDFSIHCFKSSSAATSKSLFQLRGFGDSRLSPTMRSALALLLAIPFAVAEPKFVSPAAGSTLSAGTITVAWKDGGNAPSISDLSSYQLLLFTGSNSKPFQLADLKAGSFSGGNSISVTVPSSAGGSSPKNA